MKSANWDVMDNHGTRARGVALEGSRRILVGVLALAAFAGCKREASSDAPTTNTASSSAPAEDSAPSTTNAAPTPAAPEPTAAGSAPVAAELMPIPKSFAGAAKAEVKNAFGIGCEARQKDGWLQLLCRRRNATGGTPVRALFQNERDAAFSRGEILSAAAPSSEGTTTAPGAAGTAPSGSARADTDAGAAPTFAVEPSDRGELTVVAPFAPGHQLDARIEWTDVVYDLVVRGTEAQLKRPSNFALQKACAQLTNQADGVVAAAKKSGKLTQTDTQKLPKFGRCQLSGAGAWAISIGRLEASGQGPTRAVTLALGAVHLDETGKTVTAPLGELTVAPQGFELPAPMIFDYDADGTHELLVRYDVLALPTGAAPPAVLPSIWQFKEGKVLPYPVTGLAAGGFSVEQLESDLRPDIADYGPFTAWLGSDCGVAKCPSRIRGPRFFLQSQPDGGFQRNTDATVAALRRACSSRPSSVIVSGPQGLNAEKTAERVACARAWNVETQTLVAELEASKSKLCGTAPSCPLFTALNDWAKHTPPTRLLVQVQ